MLAISLQAKRELLGLIYKYIYICWPGSTNEGMQWSKAVDWSNCKSFLVLLSDSRWKLGIVKGKWVTLFIHMTTYTTVWCHTLVLIPFFVPEAPRTYMSPKHAWLAYNDYLFDRIHGKVCCIMCVENTLGQNPNVVMVLMLKRNPQRSTLRRLQRLWLLWGRSFLIESGCKTYISMFASGE